MRSLLRDVMGWKAVSYRVLTRFRSWKRLELNRMAGTKRIDRCKRGLRYAQ